MFERIIAGVIIGIFCGFILNEKFEDMVDKKKVFAGLLALAAVGFVASSFMYGVIYGVMSLGEIWLGYWLVIKFNSKNKKEIM